MSQPNNKVWSDICKIKDELGQYNYDRLSILTKSILVIPHSNAVCERIFRKNRTDFRGSMSDKTLESILIRKQEMAAKPCFVQQFDETFLTRAKHATYKSLNE